MARRGFHERTMTLRSGSEWDAQTIHLLRLGAPIGISFVGLPVVAAGLRGIRLLDHPWLLELGMGGITVLLTALMWKISNARKFERKWMHISNVAISSAWLTAASAVDHLFLPLNGLMWTIWFLMAFGGSFAWILMNHKHADHIQDMLDGGQGNVPSGGPRYIDMGYMLRALAGAPGLRQMTEKATPAFPVLSKLQQPRAIEAGPVISGEVVKDDDDDVDPLLLAKANWIRIQKNWQIFTMRMPDGEKLRGARIVLVDLKPTMVKAKVILRKGTQLPDLVEPARHHLAVMLGVSKKRITVVPQADAPEGEVYLNFTFDAATAKKTTVWPGAPTEWSSVAQELVYGVYEDGRPASIYMAGDHLKGVVLRHIAVEGTTGAGKSNFARIAVTAGLKQLDVVDWAIDPEKSTQTWGPVAPAVDWVAVTMAEARAALIFQLDVIRARFKFLGDNGFSQWEPGCGLPLLRLWVEEGNQLVPFFGDDLESMARIARSAGVVLIVSAQSWHHGDIPTPFRDLFADKMQYGVTKIKNAFLLDSKLIDAGADPSWGVAVPGKHYWMRADLPIEDQALTVRSFYAEDTVTLRACRELAEEKHAKVESSFPDWTAMLKALDKNDTYAKRMTGTMLRATIDDTIARREAKKNGTPVPSPRPETISPTPPTGHHIPNTATVITEETEQDMDENVDPIVEEDDSRERLNPDDDTMRREMAKMGGNAEWLDEIGPDTPGSLESMMPRPDEVLPFDKPPLPRDVTKAEAVGHLIAYLAELGPGKNFTPAEVAGVLRERSGKGRGWYRGIISGEMLMLGAVEENGPQGCGRYRVAVDINSDRVRAQVDRAIKVMAD